MSRRLGTMIALVLALGLVAPGAARANGGTLQIANQPAGPYEVSVFTDPSPITVGQVDVSVMVQRPTGETVQDARVVVVARPARESGVGSSYAATHELATNKLLYAANVALGEPGRWEFVVEVAGSQGEGKAGFSAEVGEPTALGNATLLALIALAPVLALLGWWLLRSGRRARG